MTASVRDKPEVTFFHRKPGNPGEFSIEFIFEDVRNRLAEEINATVSAAPFVSEGLIRRLGIMVHARLHQGPINHVTGDINFVATVLSHRNTVLTIHDCGTFDRSRGWRHHVLRIFWLLLPLRSAAIVTTVSHASKEEIMKYARCPSDKIRVVPNAVSEKFKYRPKQFDKACPRILQVGTRPEKNIPRLAEALRGLPCKLAIVGALSAETAAALAANEIDFEHLENLPLDALVAQYDRADLVSFVSTYEGFGMPIVEANTVGRPVICGNTTSMPEVAADAACLVDPYDVGAIRAGIERIISDDRYREDLVMRGRDNAKRFDPDDIARQYLEIYREISLDVGS